MQWGIRVINELRGTYPELGAVFEIADPPVYEVDPKTRRCLPTLQVFEITSVDATGAAIKPIKWKRV